MAVEIRAVHLAADWSQARQLVQAYARSLAIDLSFQDFKQELEHLETVYGPPGGALLLAAEAGHWLGCVGIRRRSEHDSEMKRLYVAPQARGRGIGQQLAVAAMDAAVRLGYRRMLLDTLPSMSAAQALYLRLGFSPIPPYRFNPVAGTVFMALELPPRQLP
ncbi:MAG TPA: GNAT family N-acetyltransferase [Steroidobacteraceae bacterium]|nr:GNAT family N-acetyltransferase [Steroidobacteraceae bacterium]